MGGGLAVVVVLALLPALTSLGGAGSCPGAGHAEGGVLRSWNPLLQPFPVTYTTSRGGGEEERGGGEGAVSDPYVVCGEVL